MPRTAKAIDNSLLTAALEGLEAQKQRIEEQIQQVRTMLGAPRRGRPRSTPVSEPAAAAPQAAAKPARKRRELSPAARKRIAAAQKRRWAEYRKTQPPAENEE